jgi:hypothetical protein
MEQQVQLDDLEQLVLLEPLVHLAQQEEREQLGQRVQPAQQE